MMAVTLSVIDYGAGNLHSVRRALEKAGARVEITSDPDRLRAARGIVLPGVGSARSAMERLDSMGASEVIRDHVAQGKPLLGVCLGMQLFFGENEEGPTQGLDLLPGKVVRLQGRSKVPHMGWNSLSTHNCSPLLSGIREHEFVYFVHSYQVLPTDQRDLIASTDYEGEIAAAVGRDNLVGTQFHPEKSGEVGLRIYANFVEMVTRCS